MRGEQMEAWLDSFAGAIEDAREEDLWIPDPHPSAVLRVAQRTLASARRRMHEGMKSAEKADLAAGEDLKKEAPQLAAYLESEEYRFLEQVWGSAYLALEAFGALLYMSSVLEKLPLLPTEHGEFNGWLYEYRRNLPTDSNEANDDDD